MTPVEFLSKFLVKIIFLLSLQFIGKEKYDYAFFEKKLALTFKKLNNLIAANEHS